MRDKIKTAVAAHNMLNVGADGQNHGNTRVTVALSGGADSVALLHAMLELRGELGISVGACHVNHRLRAEESDKDEAFVRQLCENLGVELTVRSVDVKSAQKKHQSTEEAARQARYEFFGELLKKQKQSQAQSPCKIATAHTATDNAETVLLNLIRGTGLKGLCGIPPVRGDIIRPLILCERADIEEFCRSRGLAYATDSTNFSEEFTRNKIRLSLLPIINEINPSFAGGVTRMCAALREDSDFLDERARAAMLRGKDGCGGFDGDFRGGIGVKLLKSLEKPILSRIIIALLSNNNISPSALRIAQIMEIVDKQRGKINLEKHKFAVIEGESLKIVTIPQFYS